MTRAEIYIKLNEIFRELFDDTTITVDDSSLRADIEGWDSMEQISLVVSLENSFALKFNMSEILYLDSVKAIADLIEKRVNHA